MDTRFSVALCTFNGEPFVGQQLTSILQQIQTATEIVVSDDGSRDHTIATIERVFEQRSATARVTALKVLEGKEPLGVTKNFERAVVACTGTFIALSDQDDIWRADRLGHISAVFNAEPGVMLVHTDARLVDESGEPVGHSLLEALEYSDRERHLEASGDAFHALLRRNFVTGATTAFRRDLLDVAVPFPAEWVHDEWLALIAAATAGVRLLDEQTIDYRQHGNNQIGVALPTLVYKIRRVLEHRGERNRILAAKFAVLASRLETLGNAVPQAYLDAARSKARFEEYRANLPSSRWRRIRPVLSADRAGLYSRFASQGRADMLRDILQAA